MPCDKEEWELFVPGRLCILGEHTDWAARYRKGGNTLNLAPGLALVCATEQGLHARVSVVESSDSNGVFRFVYTHKDGDVKSFEASMGDNCSALETAASTKGFFSYAAGTAAVMARRYLSGKEWPYCLSIHNYSTTLPMGKGLSSSAAVCVLVARAFNEALDLGLSMTQLMEAAYRGEMLTPSQCGRMDQCVAMGRGRVGLMNFDGDDVSMWTLSCGAPLHMVVTDVGAAKDTIRILKDLSSAFPEPSTPVHELFHDYVKTNLRRAWFAVSAVERGDTTALGEAMNASQHAFDTGAMGCCPAELTSPALHKLLADPAIRSLSLGVKGVGSQGDGSMQMLARGPAEQKALVELLTGYGLCAFELTVPPTPVSPEAPLPLIRRRVSRAVISDLEKAAVPKSEKPWSVHLAEELLLEAHTAVELVVIVAQESDVDSIVSHFDKPSVPEAMRSRVLVASVCEPASSSPPVPADVSLCHALSSLHSFLLSPSGPPSLPSAEPACPTVRVLSVRGGDVDDVPPYVRAWGSGVSSSGMGSSSSSSAQSSDVDEEDGAMSRKEELDEAGVEDGWEETHFLLARGHPWQRSSAVCAQSCTAQLMSGLLGSNGPDTGSMVYCAGPRAHQDGTLTLLPTKATLHAIERALGDEEGLGTKSVTVGLTHVLQDMGSVEVPIRGRPPAYPED